MPSVAVPRWLLLALLLVGLILAAFHPVLGCEFVNYDDDRYVTKNDHVQHGLAWKELSWGLTTFYFSNWHPLVWWSFMLDDQLYGLKAAGFHGTNVLWHTGSTLLLFAALLQLTGQMWPSFLAAALFAVHPLNVQPVAWVSERKGVISTFFWMLALWAYARYAQQPRLRRYVSVVIAVALGLMAKQMLVTLPAVLLLLDFWPLQRWPGTRLSWLVVEKLPLLVLAIAAGLLTVLAQGGEGSIAAVEALPIGVRIKNALVSYVAYLRCAVLPTDLAAYYPHPGAVLPLWQAGTAAALLVAITALVLWQARRWPYLAVGWLWYLGTLLPVIGLVQVGTQARADRYAYVPLVGLYIAAAWGLAAAAQRWHAQRATFAGCGLVLAALVISSWEQVSFWQSSVVLWEEDIRVTGGSALAHTNLGSALLSAEPERAREQFQLALGFNRNDKLAHVYLGYLLIQQQEWAAAAAHLRQAIELDPNFAGAHRYLSHVLEQLGDTTGAAEHLRRAEQIERVGNTKAG
jgi:hypothetical protein